MIHPIWANFSALEKDSGLQRIALCKFFWPQLWLHETRSNPFKSMVPFYKYNFEARGHTLPFPISAKVVMTMNIISTLDGKRQGKLFFGYHLRTPTTDTFFPHKGEFSAAPWP